MGICKKTQVQDFIDKQRERYKNRESEERFNKRKELYKPLIDEHLWGLFAEPIYIPSTKQTRLQAAWNWVKKLFK